MTDVLLLVSASALGCAVSRAEGSPEPARAETQDRRFHVAGRVFFRGPGPLRLFLADRAAYRKPMVGVARRVLRPTPTERARGVVAYRFSGVAPGTYAIRCFQDENDNGKLDRGLFGPKEPWGMSFRPGEAKHLRPPKFEEVSFVLEANLVLDLTVD